MPRWVKLALIVGAIAALVVVAFMVLGGGGHSPRRHGLPPVAMHLHT